MITKAVGLALDESETSVDSIKKSIKKAKNAIKKLEKVSQIITVAAAAVGLVGVRHPQTVAGRHAGHEVSDAVRGRPVR